MDVIPPPITRRKKFRDALVFPPETARRGRPALISDVGLHSRLTQLLGFFEWNWARVAWDLQHARSLPSVRKALSNHAGQWPDQLSPFTYELTRRATSQDLKKSSQEITKLEAFSRLAYQEESGARDRLNVAENALNSDKHNEQLRAFYDRRKECLIAETNRLAALTEQLHKQRQLQREQQAYFCQSQLLDFIGSSRYSFSPLSFAKAMAGLPMITWRQSADRCRNLQIQPSYPLEYAKFRLFAKAVGNPPGNASAAIKRVKSFLTTLRAKEGAAGTLRKEWYYLRKAIEAAYARDIVRGAIPFCVYAEYQRCTQSRSSIDLLFAEDEELK